MQDRITKTHAERRRRRCIALLSLASLSLVGRSFGDSITLRPSADTSLFATFSDNNLGSNLNLVSGANGSGLAGRALIRFDLGNQIPSNAVIQSVALTVNFVASLPGAIQALLTGRIHSRVPATLLIAIGGFVASAGDSLNRFGVTGPFAVAKFISVVLLLAGFLVSIEAFREVRIPFTRIRLASARRERETSEA